MKKGLLTLILLGALILPTAALGQQATNISITDMVANVANVVWIVGTIIVLMFWVITGVLFLTAMGDPSKLGTAKKAFFAAIGGTVIIILAYSAVNIIGHAIFEGR